MCDAKSFHATQLYCNLVKMPDKKTQIISFWVYYKPSALLKMKTRTPIKNVKHLLYRAPFDGCFTNIDTKFTSSFIKTQTLLEVTPKDKNLINK